MYEMTLIGNRGMTTGVVESKDLKGHKRQGDGVIDARTFGHDKDRTSASIFTSPPLETISHTMYRLN